MKYPTTTTHSSEQTALTPLAQHSIMVDTTCTLPFGELAKLYRTIEAALPEVDNRVVQFASAYAGEGANIIAFETAIIAAKMVGKRVLYIDMRTSANPLDKVMGANEDTFDAMILSGRPPQEAINQAEGTNLYFTRLRKRSQEGFPSASLHAIEIALKKLRPFFDLIIIDSQAILKDAFGVALAKMVDGTILVVEAERTRAPVSAQCKKMVESGGGNIIGAVLNKRRFYIPKFLYRVLYPHSTI